MIKRTITLIMAWALLLTLCACGQDAGGQAGNAEQMTWQEQYDLGVRYLSEGNYEEAIIAFTAAIEIDPKRAEAYVGRGDAYVLSDKTEENLTAAQADYEKAIELDETLADAYLGLANVYIYRGEDDKALQILQQGYGKTDKDEDIAARIQEVGNRGEEALSAYSEFLGIDQSIAFSLVDLNADNIPELIAGPIDPYTSPLTLSEYTLYTFSDGKVTEIYHDWVDRWYQTIHLLNGNMLMTEGHGTSGYHSNHYFTWDGRLLSNFNLYDSELDMMDNIEEFHPEFNYDEEYAYGIARGYFKDGVQISQDEYIDIRKRLEEVDEILTFHVNTQDEQLRVLGYSAKQFDTPVKTSIKGLVNAKDSVISAYLNETIKQYIRNHKNTDFMEDAEEMIETYELDEFPFYVEDKQIVLCFEPNKLASAADGSVIIPTNLFLGQERPFDLVQFLTNGSWRWYDDEFSPARGVDLLVGEFLFSKDMTCIMAYGYDCSEYLGGATGTYVLDGDILKMDLVADESGKNYYYEFQIEPIGGTIAFTQISETGPFYFYTKGTILILQPGAV